ncbi:hypothetical protein D044_1744A, partial [Vibrio parahaemolyticus EKP-026]
MRELFRIWSAIVSNNNAS